MVDWFRKGRHLNLTDASMSSSACMEGEESSSIHAKRKASTFLAFVVVLCAFSWRRMLASGQDRTRDDPLSGTSRIVAVGDLHGDYERGLSALKLLRVVDEKGRWIGEDAILVQTGDILDRGSDSLALVELFHRLKEESASSGGRVYTLLGNHELMNMQHQISYVSKIELLNLGRDRSGASSGFGQRELLHRGMMAWMELLNDGMFLSKHIVELPTVAVLGEGECRTVFSHAGLLSGNLKTGADNERLINARMLQLLQKNAPQDRRAVGLTDSDGPVWNRVLSQKPESVACPHVLEVLQAFNASRMVIGHTVQRKIKTRCQGKLHLIDIGISRAYGGTPGGWQCSKGQTFAVYESGMVNLHT